MYSYADFSFPRAHLIPGWRQRHKNRTIQIHPGIRRKRRHPMRILSIIVFRFIESFLQQSTLMVTFQPKYISKLCNSTCNSPFKNKGFPQFIKLHKITKSIRCLWLSMRNSGKIIKTKMKSSFLATFFKINNLFCFFFVQI